MARIKCPNCGTERVVVEGKKKRCRKCGTTLTTLPPKPAPKVTAASLAEQYPEQIEELIRTAAATISDEERRDSLREEFGELSSEILITEYPEIVEQLTAAARKQTATETTERISGEIAETLRKKIDKLKPNEFAVQFPAVCKKIVKMVAKELKAKKKGKGQKPEDEDNRTPNQ